MNFGDHLKNGRYNKDFEYAINLMRKLDSIQKNVSIFDIAIEEEKIHTLKNEWANIYDTSAMRFFEFLDDLEAEYNYQRHYVLLEIQRLNSIQERQFDKDDDFSDYCENT